MLSDPRGCLIFTRYYTCKFNKQTKKGQCGISLWRFQQTDEILKTNFRCLSKLYIRYKAVKNMKIYLSVFLSTKLKSWYCSHICDTSIHTQEILNLLPDVLYSVVDHFFWHNKRCEGTSICICAEHPIPRINISLWELLIDGENYRLKLIKMKNSSKCWIVSFVRLYGSQQLWYKSV